MSTESKLHSYSVTDFILSKPCAYTQLSAENNECTSNELYIHALADSLQTAELKLVNTTGGFLDVYRARMPDRDLSDTAVKIIKNFAQHPYRLYQNLRQNEICTQLLKETLADPSFIYFGYKQSPYELEQLEPDELSFLGFAAEHKLYEKLYGKYILPSYFIAYESSQKTVRSATKAHGNYYNAGTKLYTMVQDFTEVQPLLKDQENSLTEGQRQQLDDLKMLIKKGYDETGLSPDMRLLQFSFADRTNIGFNSEGNLVLLDSNYFTNTEMTIK
ncbi:hypothetical protein BH09PAT2_BH09PAT2_05940 [soil metagenome]